MGVESALEQSQDLVHPSLLAGDVHVVYEQGGILSRTHAARTSHPAIRGASTCIVHPTTDVPYPPSAPPLARGL